MYYMGLLRGRLDVQTIADLNSLSGTGFCFWVPGTLEEVPNVRRFRVQDKGRPHYTRLPGAHLTMCKATAPQKRHATLAPLSYAQVQTRGVLVLSCAKVAVLSDQGSVTVVKDSWLGGPKLAWAMAMFDLSAEQLQLESWNEEGL